MKKAILIILISWIGIGSLMAQEQPETLFNGELSLSKIGIMINPGFQATQIAGENAGFAVFRGGIVFDDKITVGGFYGQMINNARPASFPSMLPAQAHLDSYQAGGFVEYTLKATKVVHFTFPLAIGMNEVEIDEEGRGFDFEENKTLFIEPGAQIEVNLHRFARLHAGLGYRIMGGTIEEAMGVPSPDNSLTFNIGLKMGLFRIKTTP